MGVRRATRDRWFLGVCGGFANTYGWNTNLVRLVTAIVAVAIPGFSVIPVLIAYVILGIILPEAPEY